MGPPIGASGARTGLVERSGRAIAAYQPAPSLSGDPGIAPEELARRGGGVFSRRGLDEPSLGDEEVGLGEPPSDAPSVQLDRKFVAPEVSANSGRSLSGHRAFARGQPSAGRDRRALC
jgi:hypothetical protein